MSEVLESPVLTEAEEKLRSDRLRWRSMLDTLPLVEVEIASAQQARADAHAALAAAQAKHAEDLAAANHAEHAAEHSMRTIEDAKMKLLNSAPEAITKKIAMLTKQLNDVRFENGADMLKQWKFKLDQAEERYHVTKNGDEFNAVERAKHKLAKLEAEIAGLQKQLDKAIGEALFAD